MTITIHRDISQGSDEWYEIRRGILTASEMKKVVSKKTDKKTGVVSYKTPDEKKATGHLYELAAQRTTGFVEPSYIGDNMIRGHEEEVLATEEYEKHYAPVDRVGFVTNDEFGFTLGYSPDGLVGDDGQIENKSRCQKYQFEAIHDNEMDADFEIQVQTGLIVTRRKWLDFNTYCGGMPMMTLRIYPDLVVQEAIIRASIEFHKRLGDALLKYQTRLAAVGGRYIPTERIATGEIKPSTNGEE